MSSTTGPLSVHTSRRGFQTFPSLDISYILESIDVDFVVLYHRVKLFLNIVTSVDPGKVTSMNLLVMESNVATRRSV